MLHKSVYLKYDIYTKSSVDLIKIKVRNMYVTCAILKSQVFGNSFHGGFKTNKDFDAAQIGA